MKLESDLVKALQSQAQTKDMGLNEFVARVQAILRGLLASGQLVSVVLQSAHPLANWAPSDPNDSEEQAFLEILAQHKREDLEQTLRELDQECSNSSSTPTT